MSSEDGVYSSWELISSEAQVYRHPLKVIAMMRLLSNPRHGQCGVVSYIWMYVCASDTSSPQAHIYRVKAHSQMRYLCIT